MTKSEALLEGSVGTRFRATELGIFADDPVLPKQGVEELIEAIRGCETLH